MDAREKGDTFLKSNEALLKKVEDDIGKIKKGPDGADGSEASQAVKAEDDKQPPAPVTPKVGTTHGRSSPSAAPDAAAKKKTSK